MLEGFHWFWEDGDYPKATLALCSLQVLIFALQCLSCSCVGKNLWYFTANSKKLREGQFWRCFTHVLLHGDVSHLVGNLLCEVIVGWTLENVMPLLDFLTLCLVCTIGSDFFSSAVKVCFSKSENVGVGASGLVFGLEAVWAFLLLEIGSDNDVVMVLFLAVYSISVFFFSLLQSCGQGANTDRVDHWAHLGGIITGILYSVAVGFNLYILRRTNFGTTFWWVILGGYFVVIVFITLFLPYFFHETVQISEVDVRILVEIHGIAEGEAREALRRNDGDLRCAAEDVLNKNASLEMDNVYV